MLTCVLNRTRYAFLVVFSLILAGVGCGGGSFNARAKPKIMSPEPAPGAAPNAPPTPSPSPGPAAVPPSVPAPPSTPAATQPAPNPPAGSQAYANVQSAPGWQSCTAKMNGHTCASGRGNAVFSMTPHVNSPSIDGQAAQFNLAGPVGYSNALWWKELGGNNNAHNFVYDLYVYLIQPNVPQSLEFDVNQTISDRNLKFIFGTECDLQATHLWHNWDTAHGHWQNTSVPCMPFQAYNWNHLVLQFQRTSNNKAVFVSVTINGQTHYFNKQFDPMPTSAYELNVAFQMDGNVRQTPYSVWLDKVTLYAW